MTNESGLTGVDVVQSATQALFDYLSFQKKRYFLGSFSAKNNARRQECRCSYLTK
jgi:hypothetical protein